VLNKCFSRLFVVVSENGDFLLDFMDSGMINPAFWSFLFFFCDDDDLSEDCTVVRYSRKKSFLSNNFTF
jgi:hypothetical protein